MNVRCHCNAPPSQPPSAKDLGQLIRSFSGIFDPKLGKARKICRPLPIITNKETVLSQWHSRTMYGCSYTAVIVLPVFWSSIKAARPVNESSQLKRIVVRIALVFPIADVIQDVRHTQTSEVFRLLVTDLRGYA